MSDNDHTLECCFSRSTFADQVLRFSSLDCSPHDRIHVDVFCHLPTTTLFWKGCQICISRNLTRRAPFFHINVIRDRLAVHHAKLLGNFEIGYETFVDTTECAAPDKADEMVIIIGENFPDIVIMPSATHSVIYSSVFVWRSFVISLEILSET